MKRKAIALGACVLMLSLASLYSQPAGPTKGPATATSSKPATGPGATRPGTGAAEWKKIFQDEKWYKDQTGKEEVFTGTLLGVQPPMASTLQRNSWYRLGDRTIYTGARKMAALDALVGKKAEIRGKAVEMSLEGQDLKEIWPAAVRAGQ